MQNMLVTIWLREKERMFNDHEVRDNYEEEQQNILNMEQADDEIYKDDEHWELPDEFDHEEQQHSHNANSNHPNNNSSEQTEQASEVLAGPWDLACGG